MDFKFKAEREEDGGLILNFVADTAIKLADWLYRKFDRYAINLVLEYSHDEREDD